MKLLPSNLGASPKTLALLGGILVVGIPLVYWSNSGSDAPQAASSPSGALKPLPNPTPEAPAPRPSSSTSSGPRVPTRTKNGRSVEDFKPSIKIPEGMDISRVDPRLKTELLARLRELPDEGGARSVFDFYVPPPPPQPVKPINPTPPPVSVAPPQPPRPPTPTGPPPPPPITIKLFALSGRPGVGRKVFFLDGDDSFMVGENDMIRNRYKIIHLGVQDAEVEDTVTKHRETIKIVPEADQ